MSLNSGIQTYQIFTNNEEVCIPSLSSILLAVKEVWFLYTQYRPRKYVYEPKDPDSGSFKSPPFLLSCLCCMDWKAFQSCFWTFLAKKLTSHHGQKWFFYGPRLLACLPPKLYITGTKNTQINTVHFCSWADWAIRAEIYI